MHPEPAIDPRASIERVELDEHSWVDVARGWLHGADELYAHLAREVPWQQQRLWRYERWVDEPRVGAVYRITAPLPHPVLLAAHKWIRDHYRVDFDGLALARYRDGRDGQAFHRDRDLRWCENTVIALLSLGARRPWLLRPRARHDKWIAETGGATHNLDPAGGDLLVMGGRAQADWEHSVPQVRGAAPGMLGRISVQWRWTSRAGRPEVGPSYRAPRHFTRG